MKSTNELHDCKWEMTNLMNVSILHHIEVPPPRIRCVYIVSTINSMLHDSIYKVTMGCYPTCTCIDFILMLTSSIGKNRKICPMQTLVFPLCQKNELWFKGWFFHPQTNIELDEIQIFLQKIRVSAYHLAFHELLFRRPHYKKSFVCISCTS